MSIAARRHDQHLGQHTCQAGIGEQAKPLGKELAFALAVLLVA